MGKKRVIKKGEAEAVGEKSKPIVSAKAARGVEHGVVHIQATYNNTLITISDDKGNSIVQSSAGALGFSGAKKATPFAAARVAETLSEKVKKGGMKDIAILVKGVGSGRDSAIRAFANQGFIITSIRDITPVPHNGPRPKKARRV